MKHANEIWKDRAHALGYLEGVRKAIPLAEHQIDVMLTLVERAMPKVGSFLDVGCGDGVLGRAILTKYPKAKGVFLDFSKAMLNAARKKMPKDNKNLSVVIGDFSKPAWVKELSSYGKFDVVVSGFSIHHQEDRRKREIYEEIFDLLSPQGLFLNTEHVASPTKWLEKVHDEYFIDSLFRHHRMSDPDIRRRDIAREYRDSPGASTDILASVEEQCGWLRQIGFIEVDCYLKIFELALFGGVKPKVGRKGFRK